MNNPITQAEKVSSPIKSDPPLRLGPRVEVPQGHRLPRTVPDAGARGGNVQHAQYTTLREHQRSLVSRRYRRLDREEAIRLGYPHEQIVQEWPNP